MSGSGSIVITGVQRIITIIGAGDTAGNNGTSGINGVNTDAQVVAAVASLSGIVAGPGAGFAQIEAGTVALNTQFYQTANDIYNNPNANFATYIGDGATLLGDGLIVAGGFAGFVPFLQPYAKLMNAAGAVLTVAATGTDIYNVIYGPQSNPIVTSSVNDFLPLYNMFTAGAVQSYDSGLFTAQVGSNNIGGYNYATTAIPSGDVQGIPDVVAYSQSIAPSFDAGALSNFATLNLTGNPAAGATFQNTQFSPTEIVSSGNLGYISVPTPSYGEPQPLALSGNADPFASAETFSGSFNGYGAGPNPFNPGGQLTDASSGNYNPAGAPPNLYNYTGTPNLWGNNDVPGTAASQGGFDNAQSASTSTASIGDYGYVSVGGGDGGGGGPVVLDLSGKGIAITPLSQSNVFFGMANDGYAQHTAWAAAGNGVLVYDPSGGAVTQANQVEFTLWDPAAKSDMQALEDVFDPNHDGVLNSSDSSWNNFRILVTNADGTQTLETLAQAGVTSINLTPNSYTQAFTDGSSINGETTFTRTNGTTGTAATVLRFRPARRAGVCASLRRAA